MSRATAALPIRLAVLVSGSGTTLQSILDAISAGRLHAEIVTVVSSRRDAYALERAARSNIPTRILRPCDFPSAKAHDTALANTLLQLNPSLIVLAGYLAILGDEMLNAFRGRIMNIHPSLLPAFGGRGCYGQRVHQAVLDAGCKVTGATVHFVEAEVDRGPIILQAAVEVEDEDTCATLAAKVGELERRLYPTAIQLYAEGRLRQVGRRVIIHNW